MTVSIGSIWRILCLSFLGYVISRSSPICRSPVKSTEAAVLHVPPLAVVEEEVIGRDASLTLCALELDKHKGLKIVAWPDGVHLQSPPQYDRSFNFIPNDRDSNANSNPQEGSHCINADGCTVADLSSISTINQNCSSDHRTPNFESVYCSAGEELIWVPKSRVLAGFRVQTQRDVAVTAWLVLAGIYTLVVICGTWAMRILQRARAKMVVPIQLRKQKQTTMWTRLLLILMISPANALDQDTTQYPSEIHLSAGVLHAPPMAIVGKGETGETSFSGFQIDLLESLKIFAAEDGVALNLSLGQSPPLHGDAFNLIANDCNTTSNPNPLEDCQKFDIIIGDYYSSSERYGRADLSPAWIQTSMATIKYIEKKEDSPDFTILAEAEEANAAVCIPKGTFLGKVVQARHPKCQYIHCNPSNDECIDLLKHGTCVLYADDELQLTHTVSHDESLELTGESFNNQYFVWPMKEGLLRPVSKLIKRWMYKAVENATLDELYIQYYAKGQCPLGSAGENCESPCSPAHGAADNRNGICICESAKWTGLDCSMEVPEELNLLPSRVVLTCYVLAGFNYTLVLFSAAWLVMNRKRAQVKMAQPMFLMLILVGCVISTSTIFAMAQEDDGDGPVPACAAIPWLYSCGFCLTFGALYARISRIYQVIHYAVEMKRVTISAGETLRTVGIILAIDVVILTVWTITDRLEWKRTITATDIFGEPLESEGYCTSDHWKVFVSLIASFHLVLMAVACYRCYLARKIPDKISNGKYVGMAMFSQVQIFCVVLPSLAMLGSDNPQTSFLLRSAAIWINDFVVVLLIFGNLRFKVLRQNRDAERLKKYNSHIALSTEIRNYAKKVRGISRSLTVRIGSAVTGRASRLGLDSWSKRDSSRRDDSSRREDISMSSNFLNRSTEIKSGKAKKQVRIFEAPASGSGAVPEEASPNMMESEISSGSSDVSFHIDDGIIRMPALEEIDSEGSEDELGDMIGSTPMGSYACADSEPNILKVDIDQELPVGLQVLRDLHEKEKEEQDIRAGKIPSIPELPELLKNPHLLRAERLTDSPRNNRWHCGTTAKHFDLERQSLPFISSNKGAENEVSNCPSNRLQVQMKPSDLEQHALPSRKNLPGDCNEVVETAQTNPKAPADPVRARKPDSCPPQYSAKKLPPQDPEAYPTSSPQPDPGMKNERKPRAMISMAAPPFDPGGGMSAMEKEALEARLGPLTDFSKMTSKTSSELITNTPSHSPTHIEQEEEVGIPREILEQAHETSAVLDEFASWVGNTTSEPTQPLAHRLSDASAT